MIFILLLVTAFFFIGYHLQAKCPICNSRETYSETPFLGYCFKCEKYYTER